MTANDQARFEEAYLSNGILFKLFRDLEAASVISR
jgi:hypothetical protein